ncbi:MAG: hypothetical protein NT067_01125 [Candidatus Diapherotrites archaeon]|nr:hypothetical protein [Candidatus Diapherotrites archaeon]
MNRLFGKKGVHSIITTFFLVVVFVSVLLLLIFFNYQGALKEQELSKTPDFIERMALLRNQADNCLKASEQGDVQALFADLAKCLPAEAKAYYIERLAMNTCSYTKLEYGVFDNCEHIFVFYQNLPQQDTKTCLARLTVCVGEGKPVPTPTTTPTPVPTPSPTPTDIGKLGDAIIIPTQPSYQKQPLKCHGLAYELAKRAEEGDPINIIRIAGPNEAFPGHNAGPYALTSPKITALETYVKQVMQEKPFFKDVTYYYLKEKVNVPEELITNIKPLKTCIVATKTGWDHPDLLFTAMGIPFTLVNPNSEKDIEKCRKEKGLIIYACPAYPDDQEDRSFVEAGGTLANTDGFSNPVFNYFKDYLNGPAGDSKCQDNTKASIWEGSTKGSFDLPLAQKKFFQTPFETMEAWHYMYGDKIITWLGESTVVLASGNYCPEKQVGPKNYPQAVMAEIGKGRYFYFAFHITGSNTENDQAFMSSLYSGAMVSKLNVYPMNCFADGKAGDLKKQACPHAEVNNRSFKLWPSLETIKNVQISAKVDGQTASWITPSENNFDLPGKKDIDLFMDVPAGLSQGEHELEITFSSANALPVVIKGKLTIS